MASPPASAPRLWTTSPRETDHGAALFVWTVWALLTVGALGYVWHYSRNVPYWDDWKVTVGVLTDTEPLTTSWLWLQMGESRVTVPKLTIVGIVKLAGIDYRAAYYYTVLSFSALAFALIRTSKTVRGRASYADAFFPLALLHWGHCEVFLWSTLIYFTLPIALVGALLVLIMRYPRRLTASAAMLAGLCFVLLTYCGVYGLMFVPPLLLWFVYAGFATWRASHPNGRRDGLVTLAMVLVTLLGVGFYFVGFSRDVGVGDPVPKPLTDIVDATGRVLAMTLGPAGKWFWPISGILPAVLFSLTLLFLVVVFWSLRGDELPRYLGLLCFTGIGALAAVGTGWKRPTEGQFELYYGTLPSLGLLSAYFAWSLYGSRALRFFAPLGFLALVAGLLSMNLLEGMRFGQNRLNVLAAVEKDIRDNMPISQVVQRHVRKLMWPEDADAFKGQWTYLYSGMQALHRQRSGPFKHLQPDVAFEESTLPLTLVMAGNMVWDDGVGEMTAADSSVYLALPEPRFVHGFRVKTTYLDDKASIYPLLLMWKFVGNDTFAGESDQPALVDIPGAPGEHQETVWVHDTIEQIYLHASNYHSGDKVVRPCVISEIVFLVPPSTSQHSRE